MNYAPLVSIIINNYNYGHFLQFAIESALSQTYRNMEVVVVDDGSTDNSRDIIASYGNRLTSILKKNGGQASAMNTGFAQSHGEVIIFLDSDDMLLPNTVERVVQAFGRTPDVVKVMYRMEVVDATGARTGMLNPSSHLPLRSGDLRRHVLTFPFDMTWMATSGNAFAAQVLRQVLPIPAASFPILADFYLAHVTSLFGRVVFLDAVGAYYRIHDSNNYQTSQTKIDFNSVCQTITYSHRTLPYILKFAKQLGLANKDCTEDDLLSVSILAKRMMLLKLDLTCQTRKKDTVWRLLRLGVKASLRRFDVSVPMRILYVAWFLAMVPAPTPVVRWLAEVFSFPEKRSPLNKLLKTFHRIR